jgi:two-component system, NarL family, nitrate/nitrite response regulator NarL
VTPNLLLREGIASLFQNTRYKVVATAARPEHLPRLQHRETLAIVGIDGQNRNVDDASANVRLLRSLMPDGKVVLASESNPPIDLQPLLKLSPDACIFNVASRETLLNVLELTFRGQRVFTWDQSSPTPATEGAKADFSCLPVASRANDVALLSRRERQVLTHLAEGKSNKVIAQLCNVTEATVKVHLKAILRKTNARNRVQAAIWAIEHSLERSH